MNCALINTVNCSVCEFPFRLLFTVLWTKLPMAKTSWEDRNYKVFGVEKFTSVPSASRCNYRNSERRWRGAVFGRHRYKDVYFSPGNCQHGVVQRPYIPVRRSFHEMSSTADVLQRKLFSIYTRVQVPRTKEIMYIMYYELNWTDMHLSNYNIVESSE